MTDEEPKTPEESKRLLKEMLKASGYSRAALVTALQEAAQQEKSDIDNSVMMRDSRGRDIFYTIIEENPMKTFFQNIKKKVFELVSRLF